MNTLCRECGKPSTPEYTDEHDGLCMACVHPIFRPVVMSESEKQFAAEVEKQSMSLCESMNIRYHDMVQPTDPTRDAIAQQFVDWNGFYAG